MTAHLKIRNDGFSPSLLKRSTNGCSFPVCPNQITYYVKKWAALPLPLLLLLTERRRKDRKDRPSSWYQNNDLPVRLQHRLASMDPNPTQASNMGRGWTPKPDGKENETPSLSSA